MRIIKDATLKKYKCKYCNSVLEVTKKDIWREKLAYHNIDRYMYYFICPCCDSRNVTDTDSYEID